MITASIKFLDNGVNIDLPCRNGALTDNLGSAGILINPNALLLSNARTVKINLIPEDDIDKNIISLINPTDTLGKLNKVCNVLNSLDYRDYDMIQKGLEDNKYRSLSNLLEVADRLKGKRRGKENLR
jgi:hypothetical protein